MRRGRAAMLGVRRWAGMWLLAVLGWHVVRVAAGLACVMPAMGTGAPIAGTVAAARAAAHGDHARHAGHAALDARAVAAHHEAAPSSGADAAHPRGDDGAHGALACASGMACAVAVAAAKPAETLAGPTYAAAARLRPVDATVPPHAARAPETPPPKG
jgi:hypothetical protein